MTHIRTLMDHMIQIDEGRMKDIFTADEEGKSAKEIAKALKLPLGTVKKILGEDNELQEFSSTQLDILAKQYASLKGKTISVDNANKLRQIFKRIPDSAMNDIRKKKIPFLSGLALSRMVQKGMPVKESTFPPKDSKEKPKETPKEGDAKSADALEKQLVVATGQINLLKQKIENEKNKVTKPAPNKETGEVPLTVGIAYKHLKDKLEKEKEEKKEEVKEAFSVQITKTDGGKFIHGTYKSKAEAEKWIKWYKTGDLRKTKKIEIVKEDKDGKAYAIGMVKAKEVMKDEPPLEKKTITKAHDIAKAIKRDETIRIRPKNAIGEKKSPFRLSYSKQGTHAGFEDADTLSDLQNKAQKLRSKGFTIDKMGRNTSPVKEETIVEYTDKQIKQAYGILNDPRYKGGNYSGAVAAIEKLAKGLSKHKDVANALKRANESYVHPGKATFERIYREVSDKLKLKVLDRKIKRAKDKFHKGLRRP